MERLPRDGHGPRHVGTSSDSDVQVLAERIWKLHEAVRDLTSERHWHTDHRHRCIGAGPGDRSGPLARWDYSSSSSDPAPTAAAA